MNEIILIVLIYQTSVSPNYLNIAKSTWYTMLGLYIFTICSKAMKFCIYTELCTNSLVQMWRQLHISHVLIIDNPERSIDTEQLISSMQTVRTKFWTKGGEMILA